MKGRAHRAPPLAAVLLMLAPHVRCEDQNVKVRVFSALGSSLGAGSQWTDTNPVRESMGICSKVRPKPLMMLPCLRHQLF